VTAATAKLEHDAQCNDRQHTHRLRTREQTTITSSLRAIRVTPTTSTVGASGCARSDARTRRPTLAAATASARVASERARLAVTQMIASDGL
jgi:hypothetical protein